MVFQSIFAKVVYAKFARLFFAPSMDLFFMIQTTEKNFKTLISILRMLKKIDVDKNR